MIRRILAGAFLLALALEGAAAAPAPKLRIASFDKLAQPLPLPYDERANADAQVATAKGRARRTGKLLLIDLGGNWCGDCRVLAGTMELPELRRFIARHYETVMVDIGRLDRNLQVPARYGITKRLEGVPALLIVDARTDRLLNPGRVSALSDARHMSPQALADWLAQWTR